MRLLRGGGRGPTGPPSAGLMVRPEPSRAALPLRAGERQGGHHNEPRVPRAA
jgi:hypothetical protein